MNLNDLDDRDAVLQAMAEFDRLGRDQFLAQRGFRKAKRYMIAYDGRLYDAKAVVGYAYGLAHPNSPPITGRDFRSGEIPVRQPLERMGFNVVERDADLQSTRVKPSESIATLLTRAMARFRELRAEGPKLRKDPDLWSLMNVLARRLEALPPIAQRPSVHVDWSVGEGMWADVPWIAFLDHTQTQSTQRGVFPVLLMSKDLTRAYLTLNQGAADIVKQHGRGGARGVLRTAAATLGQGLTALLDHGYVLSNDIELGKVSWRPQNYVHGAIAFRAFTIDRFPTDAQFAGMIEPLLSAVERLHETAPIESGSPGDNRVTYTVRNIIDDGCFVPEFEIGQMISALHSKKNLVLQGPPGTGKTWLAKRLGCALIGTSDADVTDARLRVVQFHPSLSYEDFVRGYRPTGGLGLELQDGAFLEHVEAALQHPRDAYVLVIEEVNRGNPAQIFGEMLTLLENTKRTPQEALRLAYPRAPDERIHIPENLYVIGTMNVADRSLALVDLALRRRFAFVSLEPRFGPAWEQWCRQKGGLRDEVITLVRERLLEVNRRIADDRSLGAQFQIGHSFVTPTRHLSPAEDWAWFLQVAATEIEPLLSEYWFDQPTKVQEAYAILTAPAPI